MSPYDITESDIAECTNIRLLRIWHDRFHAEADNLASEVKSGDLTGILSRGRRREIDRSLCQCFMAMKRIEHRALALGHEPILTRGGYERRIIKRLLAQLEDARNQLAQRDVGRAA